MKAFHSGTNLGPMPIGLKFGSDGYHNRPNRFRNRMHGYQKQMRTDIKVMRTDLKADRTVMEPIELSSSPMGIGPKLVS